jgi:hypothetical protein
VPVNRGFPRLANLSGLRCRSSVIAGLDPAIHAAARPPQDFVSLNPGYARWGIPGKIAS